MSNHRETVARRRAVNRAAAVNKLALPTPTGTPLLHKGRAPPMPLRTSLLIALALVAFAAFFILLRRLL